MNHCTGKKLPVNYVDTRIGAGLEGRICIFIK